MISAPEMLPHEGERITCLFEEGLARFHLRKPAIPLNAIKGLLVKIPKKYHQRIAFHQHHDWAIAQGYSRIHLPEQMRLTLGEKTITGPAGRRIVLSTSVHDLENAESLSPQFSYAFIGPVFPSISKPGYHPSFNFLDQDLKELQTPLVALGGVCAENVPRLIGKGFSAIALLGSIWEFPPEKGTINFLKCREASRLLASR